MTTKVWDPVLTIVTTDRTELGAEADEHEAALEHQRAQLLALILRNEEQRKQARQQRYSG